MAPTTDPIMIRAERRRMIDEAMDAYVDWREECNRVWDAYRGWMSATRADAALAFPAYVAALDREERASEVYEVLISRLYPPVTPTSHRQITQTHVSGAQRDPRW